MPKNISDEEYSYLQSRRQVADFVESIYNDPNLNKEAKRLIKRKYPNLAIPDYDLEEKVESRLNARDEEDRKRKDEEQRELEDARYRRERERTQKEYGFTDDAMNEMEQMMVSKNIGDYEAAAMLMAKKNPKSSESTYDSHFWNHEKSDGFNEIAKDPEGWGRNELMKAIRADQDRQRG
jgi:hypothetical protein